MRGRRAALQESPWDKRRRADAVRIHERRVARAGRHARDAAAGEERIEKGRLADVGGAEDDDFRYVLVDWVVRQAGGRVEELRAPEEAGGGGRRGIGGERGRFVGD